MRKTKNKCSTLMGSIALIWVSLAFSSNASASLIGDTVDLVSSSSTGGTNAFAASSAVVIDPGIEFSNAGFTVDFFAESIVVGSTGAFTGSNQYTFNFTSLDWVGMPLGIITDISLTLLQPALLLTDYSTGFGDHSITVSNAQHTNTISQGAMWRIDITTSHGVPTPATLALFGLGLAGLGWSKRKKV